MNPTDIKVGAEYAIGTHEDLEPGRCQRARAGEFNLSSFGVMVTYLDATGMPIGTKAISPGMVRQEWSEYVATHGDDVVIPAGLPAAPVGTPDAPRHRGFTAEGLRSGPGRDFDASEMVILYNGVKVATSYNSGSGGCDIRHWSDREAEAKFQSLADDLYPGETENTDQVATDLGTAANMASTSQGYPFVMEDSDFWNMWSSTYARFQTLKTALPFEEARTHLAKNRPGARIWDPAAEDFVAA